MFRCKTAATTIALAGLLLFSAKSQAALTGTVKDAATQTAIAGATVSLESAGTSTLTDANGAYNLTSTAVQYFGTSLNKIVGSPFFRGNALTFGVVGASEQVRIGVFTVSGRMVASLLNSTLASGNYQFNPSVSNLASQVYFVKIQIGSHASMFKMPLFEKVGSQAGGVLRKVGVPEGAVAMGKTAASLDTLVVTAAGYVSLPTAISSYTGTNNVSITALAGKCSDPNRWAFWDNNSYSGCQGAAQVIVDDSLQPGPTIKVRIRSTADTVGFSMLLHSDPTTPFQFVDSIHFNIYKTDSSRHVIKVQDKGTANDSVMDSYVVCAANGATKATISGYGVQWSGNIGVVGPGASIYQGLTTKITVNLTDNDLTDTVAFVTVKNDSADTVGIQLALKQVKSSPGSFTGQLGVSLTASSQANGVIKVKGQNLLGGENITLLYNDICPPKVSRGSICTWRPMLGSIALDSAAYHGTTGQANITLYDDDIAANKTVVLVKSKKNTTGFFDTLVSTGTGSARVFTGKLGFSTTATSAATDIIQVQSPDTVSLIYTDTTPDSVVTKKAAWSAQ
jgi:hypothetical protein